MGISREIWVTGLQILGNFPCANGELVLCYIHRYGNINFKMKITYILSSFDSQKNTGLSLNSADITQKPHSLNFKYNTSNYVKIKSPIFVKLKL